MELYQLLCKELSISRQEIDKFLISAPKMYKIYFIPKRTSGRRRIAHPSKALKKYQRALIPVLKRSLPIHKSAMAYREGVGVKKNARAHLHSKYLLKMDFQNFFHSITPELFFSYLDLLGFSGLSNGEDRYLLKNLLFHNPSKKDGGKLMLSVGAPSSPFISNTVLCFFDASLSEICSAQGIRYTRYADDLTFSTNNKNTLFPLPNNVKTLLKESFDGLINVNESKTVFSSKAHNRHITGVTLTNDDKLSIGRERKRYISSLIHQFSLSQMLDEDVSYLQGLFAFACDIEPIFKDRMIKKYSADTIEALVRSSS